MPRLKDYYLKEVVPAMIAKFGYKNIMQVPKLEKVVINMGLGDARDNARAMEMAVDELTTIAGQKAQVTLARKSVANFKVRAGMKVEINYNQVEKVRGMDIIFVTTARTDEEAHELLRLLGMPFAQNA